MKKIRDAISKPFKSGSSSSSNTPLQDLLKLLQDFQLLDLDQTIETLTKAINQIQPESKDEFQLESRLSYVCDTGSQVFQKISDTSKKISEQASSDGTSVIANVLERVGNTHYVGLCLSVVVFALKSFKARSNNRTECIQLLQNSTLLIGEMKKMSSSPSFSGLLGKDLNNIAEYIVLASVKVISITSRSKKSRTLFALIDQKDLKTIHNQIQESFPKLNLMVGTSILSMKDKEIFYKPKPEKIDTVGMESLIEKVVDDLRLEQQGRNDCSCVCLHAMGGAGKSTLAECVYYRFAQDQQRLHGYYHCKVELDLDENSASLLEMQKQILEKLLESPVREKMSHIKDGAKMVNDIIERLNKPVFLVLDNLNLTWDQVEAVVPKAAVLKPGSAILVTTRDQGIKNPLEDLGFTPIMTPIPMLKDDDARELLYRSMGCDRIKMSQRVAEECEKELLKACGGIPLVINIAGGVIRARNGLNKEEVWHSVVESIREGRSISGKAEEKDPVLASLKFSIDDLSQELRQSFFDIVTFFNHKNWWYVAYALGEATMEELKGRHLIEENVNTIEPDWDVNKYNISEVPTRLSNTSVEVHDVMHGLGLSMMEKEDRVVIAYRAIRELQSLESFDNMKLRRIRGIHQAQRVTSFERHLLPWSVLCQMENIRVLEGVLGVEIEQFMQPLKNLRVFIYNASFSSVPFDMDKAPKLKIFEAAFLAEKILKLPEGLKYLALFDCSGPLSFENWHLEYINLISCNVKMLEGIEHCSSLKHLRLYGCHKLREVDGLTTLETLEIDHCSHIQSLKSSNFSALRYLRLHNCPRLKQIPVDMGNLHYLKIEECPSLTDIPNFLKFTQIQCFFCNGTSVKEIPLPPQWTDQQSSYPSLRHISLTHSYHLKELPNAFFCYFPNLETLDLSKCISLVSLPKENCIAAKSQVRILSLEGCVSLETLDLSGLSRLETINISQCWKLHSFKSIWSIFSFGRLKKLSMVGCWRLKKEAAEIFQHLPPSMQYIDVTGCLNMEEVDEFIPNKKMASVQVYSKPYSWRQEMNGQEMLEKISEVLQSLHFLDSKDNVIPGTELGGNLVYLVFGLQTDLEKIIETANHMQSELVENAGKSLRFIYLAGLIRDYSILPEHWITPSLYHSDSLFTVIADMWKQSSGHFSTVITKVGDGSKHVFSDAEYLWKQFGLAGYPFSTDHLARVADPSLSLSSLFGKNMPLILTPNVFPFVEEKFVLSNRSFLYSTAYFLVNCNDFLSSDRTKLSYQKFLKSLEGTIVCFLFICIRSQQSLEMIVKDYHNLKVEWKEQLRVICLLDEDLKENTASDIPDGWLIPDGDFEYRERLEVDTWKQDKKNLVLHFLLEWCYYEEEEWFLGFDGEGQIIIIDQSEHRRLFASYLQRHHVYNELDANYDNVRCLISDLDTISLPSKIDEVWDSPESIHNPQHHPCQLFICLASRFCDICQRHASMIMQMDDDDDLDNVDDNDDDDADVQLVDDDDENDLDDNNNNDDVVDDDDDDDNYYLNDDGDREWFYGCSLCDFHMCLDCHAKIQEDPHQKCS